MKPELSREAIEGGLQSLTWQRGLTALCAFVGFFLVAKLAGYLVRRVLSKHPQMGGPRFALSKLLTYFIVFVGLISSLSLLGLPMSSLVLTLSALLVGVGFSLQHTARDVVSGIVILVEQRVRKGDFVTFADISGTVHEIGLRSTCVLTRDGTTLVVPNHLLVTTELSNQSYPLERARLHVQVPVALHADIDAVEEALFEVARSHSVDRLGRRAERHASRRFRAAIRDRAGVRPARPGVPDDGAATAGSEGDARRHRRERAPRMSGSGASYFKRRAPRD